MSCRVFGAADASTFDRVKSVKNLPLVPSRCEALTSLSHVVVHLTWCFLDLVVFSRAPFWERWPPKNSLDVFDGLVFHLALHVQSHGCDHSCKLS